MITVALTIQPIGFAKSPNASTQFGHVDPPGLMSPSASVSLRPELLKNPAGNEIAQQRVAMLSIIKIPEIDFDEVPLTEAIDGLSRLIEIELEKLAEAQKFHPNFFIKDPNNKFSGRTVTLKLKRVPAKVVLDYLLEQGGAKARFDDYATVIEPVPTTSG